MNNRQNQLSSKKSDELIKALKARFEENMHRHKGLDWTKVQMRLEANPEKLWSLNEMERTGGEPDVVKAQSDEKVFATTMKRWHPARNTSRKAAPSAWLRPWA